MQEMSRQNAALLEEVRDLRRENTQLRRELDAARGRQVHEPYVPGGMAAAAVSGDGRPASPAGRVGDILMDLNSPGPERDAKRAKAEAGEDGRHDA
jgi:hypothetical protein